ncbi:MAG: Ig-like domain-containing protein, partial [Bacilli bacterium]|nr:Ig-like domain-containing protein [Bacilli bacterium]
IDTSTIKTEYEVGDVFQWTGLDVTAYYEGGMSSSVPLGGYEISTPDMSTAGTKTITVSYGALDNIVTKTFTITVSDPTPVKPTIVSVSLTKNPSKTTYFPGETIIFDGEITAHMSDGNDEVLDNDEWIKNIDPNTAGGVGYHTITVNIKNTSGKYVQFGISVIAVPSILENISISGQKTDYWTGEAFEPSGVVKAHYSGGTTKTVTPTQYSEVDTSTPGTKTVTVYYTEDTITVTCSYNIIVKDKPTIVDYTISGGKREFVLGESFSQGNLSVTVKYSDGTERSDVPFNVDSTHFDGTKLGTYEIFVTVPEYSGEVKSYTVTVNKALINNIELRYTSSKVDAKPGDQQEIIFKKPDPTGEYFDYDDFTYESSNSDIAEVQMINGVPTIVYKDYGNCVITIKAKAGSGVATYQVNVLKHVTGISLDKAEAEVNIHETLTLNATITPADADDKKVIWISSNESIATVDANGVVTGIKEGTVTITATANDKVLGTKSASCEVTVKKVPVTSVTLDKITEEALVGDKFKLNATVEPDNATFPEVKWSSSNEKVAKVDQNGNVTCVKEGVATITVINEDSGLSATCVVTVSKIDVESVAINKETLDLVVGNNETLVATVSPDNATYKDVTWSSSDTSVAKVDANGKVTAVAPGTATITVKTNDGEKVATCTVTVRAIPVESVSLDETTAKLDIGQTLDLVATVTPENATNKDVTFSTSNADIATVDENGKVTAVAVGEVTITVTTADGAKTATCTVTVYDKAAQTKKNLIVLGAASGGVIVVGAGCGIGIPLGLRAKKRKHLK